MLKSTFVAIGASAFLGVFGIIETKAAGDPLHGRPRYENLDGKEWIFYLTQENTDWYLEPKGQLSEGFFRILIRGVSPGSDNYGVLQLDCGKKLVSVYFEPWEKIPDDSPLINGLYKDFCNLKQAY